MQTLGQKIKELREENNLTQIELARLLFIDKSTVAKYETDVIEPSYDLLKKLAKLFKVSTDYLLGMED
ncbi:MAG: helix-turn-helix transcriptional regulator [Clostridia bacterium]|nr:helix-turn-helix transcriptional regulator [Clostridia bacterium]